MVDVTRKDSTSASNLRSDVFRCDVTFYPQFLTVHVFTDCNVFHFRGYDPSFGIVHLRDMFSFDCTTRKLDMFKAKRIQLWVSKTLFAIFACHLTQLLCVISVDDPFLTETR